MGGLKMSRLTAHMCKFVSCFNKRLGGEFGPLQSPPCLPACFRQLQIDEQQAPTHAQKYCKSAKLPQQYPEASLTGRKRSC